VAEAGAEVTGKCNVVQQISHFINHSFFFAGAEIKGKNIRETYLHIYSYLCYIYYKNSNLLSSFLCIILKVA